jgi:hypothetical protein
MKNKFSPIMIAILFGASVAVCPMAMAAEPATSAPAVQKKASANEQPVKKVQNAQETSGKTTPVKKTVTAQNTSTKTKSVKKAEKSPKKSFWQRLF